MSNDHTPDLHRASQALLRMMCLYSGSKVLSRGPIGCIHDALKEIAPDVQKQLSEGVEPEELVENDEDNTGVLGRLCYACNDPATKVIGAFAYCDADDPEAALTADELVGAVGDLGVPGLVEYTKKAIGEGSRGMATSKKEKRACAVLDFEGTNCPACGAPKASHIAAREDYVTTVCGGCDRPKEKCTCSDGDCA